MAELLSSAGAYLSWAILWQMASDGERKLWAGTLRKKLKWSQSENKPTFFFIYFLINIRSCGSTLPPVILAFTPLPERGHTQPSPANSASYLFVFQCSYRGTKVPACAHFEHKPYQITAPCEPFCVCSFVCLFSTFLSL